MWELALVERRLVGGVDKVLMFLIKMVLMKALGKPVVPYLKNQQQKTMSSGLQVAVWPLLSNPQAQPRGLDLADWQLWVGRTPEVLGSTVVQTCCYEMPTEKCLGCRPQKLALQRGRLMMQSYGRLALGVG